MARRTTDYRSVVIVCEGSDTEFIYFTEVKDYITTNMPGRFDKIKVVPVADEIIREKNPSRKSKGCMKPINDKSKQFHYWCLFEESEEVYNKYRQQPTRYVREAALYIEKEGFTDAWVVYDKDVHPDHENAVKYASSLRNVHIAFSSYCFEEWFLTHFGRFSNAYNHSECKDSNGELLYCGTGVHCDDCNGTKCLGGKLRASSFIPSYSKNLRGIFTQFTIPRLRAAHINASWLRSLSDAPIYTRNPYTDVDLMLLELLGDSNRVYWCTNRRPLIIDGYGFTIEQDGNNIVLTNTGRKPIVLTKDNIHWVSNGYKMGRSVLSTNIILRSEDNYSFAMSGAGDLFSLSLPNMEVIFSC